MKFILMVAGVFVCGLAIDGIVNILNIHTPIKSIKRTYIWIIQFAAIVIVSGILSSGVVKKDIPFLYGIILGVPATLIPKFLMPKVNPMQKQKKEL